MTQSTDTPRKLHVGRRITYGVLGAGAASLAFAPAAHADPLTDAAADFTAATGVDVAPPQAPVLPSLPQMLDGYMTDIQSVAPSNLLRTRSAATAGDAAEAPLLETAQNQWDAQRTPQAQFAPVTVADMNAAATRAAASEQVNAAFPPVQTLGDALFAQRDARGDSNVIGQGLAAGQVPTQDTINQITADGQHLLDNALNGQLARDVQTAIDNTLNSDAMKQWQANTASILGVDQSLTGTDRGAAGISALIDSATRDPLRATQELLQAAGGPARALVDPVGALVDATTAVLGPDLMASFNDFMRSGQDALEDALKEAAPALLVIPAMALIGGLLGGPLGALTGSGIGALIGALSPHNILVGLLTAIPGAILGGLATGALGLLASGLISLGSFMTLPPAGAASGSALALVILSTITYGLWLLSFIPVTIFALGAGILAGLAVAALLVAISGANPIMFASAIGGGLFTLLFVTTMIIGGYALLTFLIPTIAFLVLAPLFIGGGLLGGLLAGLAAATLISALAIPLITALSAIPGALSGGILGYLLGDGISRLISTLIGAGIGGLLGYLAGFLTGATIGGLIGTPIALALFAAIAGTRFGDWLAEANADPNQFPSKLREALDRGWRESALGQIFGTLERELWATDSGQYLGDLMKRLDALSQVMTFLDGRRLREMLLRGALLGGGIGAAIGAPIGGTIGALLGLLSPMNLINGLMGALAGAAVGAPLGAAAGKALSMLLGALTTAAVTPLSFLPILAALGLGYTALATLATLAALASTLIPPLALATAATIIGGLTLSAPLWIPLTILSTLVTLVAFALTNTALIAAFPPLAALLPFNFIIGNVAIALAWANVLVIGGALLLAAVFIGIPTFLITAPLFTFGALAVPLGFLLGAPGLIPVAMGLSLLAGLAAGSLVDNLSSLLTVPLGALLGAGLGALAGGIPALLIATAVRTITYGIAGALAGAGIGAAIGAPAGALAALLTHLRVDSDLSGDTKWIDGRILNMGGFGDELAGLPGLSGERTVAVPRVASTGLNPAAAAPRELVDVTRLIAA